MPVSAAHTEPPRQPSSGEVTDRVGDLLRVATFPGLLGGGLMLAWVVQRLGVLPELIVAGSTLLGLIVLLPIQRRIPWRAVWQHNEEAEVGTDLLHLLLSNGVTGALASALTFGALTAGAIHLAALFPAGLWPSWLPLAFQVLLAMVAGEFAFYWLHRLAHTFDGVWRWHAVHHCSERLNVWSAARNHPVNAAASYLSQVAPAVLLGATPDVLLYLSVWTTLHGMLQHANIDLRLGSLDRVFSTANLHRWHHSTLPAEGHTNYGSNLMLWDHVFGTFEAPPPEGPAEVGVVDTEIPDGYLGHLRTPFAWKRLPRPS